MTFYSLKDLIPKTAGNYKLQGELKAAMVINRASATLKEIFPEEVEKYIRVKRFSDKVLLLTVTHSAAAQEVHEKSYELKKLINSSFDEELILKVRCVQETEVSEFEI